MTIWLDAEVDMSSIMIVYLGLLFGAGLTLGACMVFTVCTLITKLIQRICGNKPKQER